MTVEEIYDRYNIKVDGKAMPDICFITYRGSRADSGKKTQYLVYPDRQLKTAKLSLHTSNASPERSRKGPQSS